MTAECKCYPRLASMTAEERQEMQAMTVSIGIHATYCPLWVDKAPLYTRAGDALPGYTRTQQRRDENAEAVR